MEHLIVHTHLSVYDHDKTVFKNKQSTRVNPCLCNDKEINVFNVNRTINIMFTKLLLKSYTNINS